jgi:hypothetical protein
MKKLLLGLTFLTLMSSFANNSSCLDHNTLTGLSDRAVLEVSINSFQQGYLEDIDSSIELRLDTFLKDYDMVSDSTDEYGRRVLSKGNISGGGERINRLSFSYEEQEKMKLNEVSVKSSILLSDLHRELYSASNPRYAELEMELSEVDYLTPNEEIGKTSISIEALRQGVLKFNGNLQFNIEFKKERTKAIGTLKVRCN